MSVPPEDRLRVQGLWTGRWQLFRTIAGMVSVVTAVLAGSTAALDFVRGFQNVSAALVTMSDSDAARAVERLRETLAAHKSHDQGVTLDSRAWLITARRR